ncbi:isocitrate lyase/PEP mutase family protein [Fodinicurvata sediminis]|uniref:isocitrate lyase/PEP mutase family protein n=1 Tax=Fodinicurvata sediminis TaxID=1121832 RepID=UPI00041B3700|nr:isocitrate lyase/PEP mutase family protein [Fodinicurvata sediminis]
MTDLKRKLAEGDCVLAPGVYDCVSARIAETAGFEAVSISGYGVEASSFGLPDLGFTGLFDLVEIAGRIVSAVDIPVICDADTGYGGPAQVWETTRRLEKQGVQALHIEDQGSPKRCGGLPGRKVIPTDEMSAKIRAACQARRSTDFLVIARTDAKDSEGLEAAAKRLNSYFAAGADLGFAAENYSFEELQELSRLVKGPLAICGGVPGWSGSFETSATYRALGIVLVIYPFTSLFTAARAMQDFYMKMKDADRVTPDHAERAMTSFDWFSDFIGVDGMRQREEAVARDGDREKAKTTKNDKS